MVEQQGKPKRKYLHRAQSTEQIERKPSPIFDQGVRQGFKKGKEEGFRQGKQIGFDEGHKHLVALVEEIIMKELGLPSREALAKSGKLPALWIVALLKYHKEKTAQRKLAPEVETLAEPTREQLEQLKGKEA